MCKCNGFRGGARVPCKGRGSPSWIDLRVFFRQKRTTHLMSRPGFKWIFAAHSELPDASLKWPSS